MPLSFPCPHCDHKLNAPAELAGKRVKCPECSGILIVPGGASEPSTQLMDQSTETTKPFSMTWLVVAGGIVAFCILAAVIAVIAVIVLQDGDGDESGSQLSSTAMPDRDQQLTPAPPEVDDVPATSFQADDVESRETSFDDFVTGLPAPNEAEATAFAMRLKEAIIAEDVTAFLTLMASEFIFRYATRNLPASPETQRLFEDQFEPQLLARIPESIANAIAEAGSYKFLRTRMLGEKRTVLFRLITAKEGFSYHEFTLAKVGSNRVRAVDLFNYNQHVPLSDLARQARRVRAVGCGRIVGTIGAVCSVCSGVIMYDRVATKQRSVFKRWREIPIVAFLERGGIGDRMFCRKFCRGQFW